MFKFFFVSFLSFWMLFSCFQSKSVEVESPILKEVKTIFEEKNIQVGATQMEFYLPLLKDKKIGLIVNQTSTVGAVHLVDTLLKKGIDIQTIFAPEHGFRGTADAGETIANGVDKRTGIPVLSLYGKRKKPLQEDLKGIELIVFDIQDVGARFYTYISTMSYVMEACAENDIPFLVFDRPNPNGHYVDGPVLNEKYSSFVGLHPVPVVHGMTVGEYAQMVNGEGWLENGIQSDLSIIPCANYSHQSIYELPIKPSPNLPNQRSIYLYPSLCFLEGTKMSVGRGTDKQFQIMGAPDYGDGDFQFTPVSIPGAKYPKHQNQVCTGHDFTTFSIDSIRNEGLNLQYLLDAYRYYPNKEAFFLSNNFINKLAGNNELKQQIIDGWTEQEIRESWKEDLEAFKQIRKKYLIYE